MEKLIELSKKDRLVVLKTVGDDMQNVMKLEDPPLRTKGRTEAQLLKDIQEASEFIEEGDKFSEETTAALEELKALEFSFDGEQAAEPEVKKPATKKRPVKKEVEVPEIVDEPTLMEEIEEAGTLKELKVIANTNEEFDDIKAGLKQFRTADALREAMLDVLAGEESESEEVKPAVVKKPAKSKSAEKKDSGVETHAAMMDRMLSGGGAWDDVIADVQAEVDKMGKGRTVTKAYINSHLKYREKQGRSLGLKESKDGKKLIRA